MNDFTLSTENTCDLSKEYMRANNISYTNLSYTIDGTTYDGKTQDIDYQEFYKLMRNGCTPNTSMVNTETATEYFTDLLKQNKDILHISFASVCSGTYGIIKKVADELNKTNKNKIYVIDSKNECLGQGLIVMYARDYQKSGHDINDTIHYINTVIPTINSLFTVENLKYLARGGRVSKSSANIANFLLIKPILYVNNDGYLTPKTKVITRKSSLNTLANLTIERINKSSNKIIIGHCDDIKDATYLKNNILAKIDQDVTIDIEPIGYVVGSHSGPGTIAIFFKGYDKNL